MRTSSLALLSLLAVPAALAQNATNGTGGTDAYVLGLVSALQMANLTALAGIAESIANTTAGQALLASLPMGNKTIFAPNNAAFAAVPTNVTQNLDLLGEVLEYHFISGAFPASSFAMSPNHTIARTFLNDSSVVMLEANKSQVVVASNMSGQIMLLNQPQNVSVLNSTMYQNLVVHIIDGVLSIPPTLANVATTANLTTLLSAAEMANLTEPLLDAHGITIFAPSDAAFNTALAMLGSSAENATVIGAVLANHVINGTTLYSTNLMGGMMNYTSAAGEALMTMSNSSGLYVMSANTTAKVLQSDILISNGVVHMIDTVLVNAMENPSAASSAYMSATSAAATQTMMETAPVGVTPAASASASASSTAAKSGGVVSLKSGAWLVGAGVTAIGGFVGGLLLL